MYHIDGLRPRHIYGDISQRQELPATEYMCIIIIIISNNDPINFSVIHIHDTNEFNAVFHRVRNVCIATSKGNGNRCNAPLSEGEFKDAHKFIYLFLVNVSTACPHLTEFILCSAQPFKLCSTSFIYELKSIDGSYQL